MTEVTTTRPINLGQLSAELDGAPLTAATVGDETTVTAHGGVPTAKLQAAVDAHVPAPVKTLPDIETLTQMVRELSDIVMEI